MVTIAKTIQTMKKGIPRIMGYISHTFGQGKRTAATAAPYTTKKIRRVRRYSGESDGENSLRPRLITCPVYDT